VREAMLRAIDLEAMRKGVLAAEFAASRRRKHVQPAHVGCAWTEKPITYDPAKAKAL